MSELLTDDHVDAARYRWLRSKAHSLESQHGGGKSCYHVVGEVRELRSGEDLDGAVDAAIAQATKNDEAIKQLLRFYSVTTLEELSLAQDRHIERLQARLSPACDEQPRKVREG